MARRGTPPVRRERDALGEVELPADVYYGVQTQRAVGNFPISGLRAHPALVRATIWVKKAAALANMATGRLDPRVGQAIVAAADEALAGQFDDQFVVDVYQAGAGTSHNMNANEVLANRAIELLGGKRGDYSLVSPNDHVNMAQSTNDVFPTAMRLAALALVDELQPALDGLSVAFAGKGREFDPILKSGRTHLQDATPIRLGQEFAAYGITVRKGRERIAAAAEALRELNIGGTAVGTGLNAEPAYIDGVVRELSRITSWPLRRAEHLPQIMQSMGDIAHLSGALRTFVLDLGKICNDLRLLASGPRTGLYEIVLPPVQPGSSIMPGKVNPVMAEMLNMVCFQVLGCDAVVAAAGEAGQLELNVMMPVIAHNLLHALTILRNACRVFTERCVAGITANEDACRRWNEASISLATAFAPYIGYLAAAELAKESWRTGRYVRELAIEKKLLSEEQIDRILDPWKLTEPGVPGKD